eukprot:CAMPEP_0195286052 /NCGR_PEP_ID=MMETSP0707-20130614/3654_1 /TAXON_ID=33640 /ORGANISM="Asterionellopsis glacialis, Strain CCMP134" /LENGTH=641 /DNA_ID=CAMNT_0040345645 /DNA_START=37 /DNA_END=1962 /DNA_ORIENTATION=-
MTEAHSSIGNSLNRLNEALTAANNDIHLTGNHNYRQKEMLKEKSMLKNDSASSSFGSSKKSVHSGASRSVLGHSSAPDRSDVFAGLVRKKGSVESPQNSSESCNGDIEIKKITKSNNTNPEKIVLSPSGHTLNKKHQGQKQQEQPISPKTKTTKSKKKKRQERKSSLPWKGNPAWTARIHADDRISRLPDIQSIDSRNSFPCCLPQEQKEIVITNVTPTTSTKNSLDRNAKDDEIEVSENATAAQTTTSTTPEEQQETNNDTTPRSQSILQKLLRLDQEEVAQHDAFASEKLRKGIQHIRSSQGKLARWQSSYEVDAPRLLVPTQEQNHLSSTTSFQSCSSISRLCDSDYDENDSSSTLLENFPLQKPDRSWQKDIPQQGSWTGIDAILTDDSSSEDEDEASYDDDKYDEVSTWSSWKNSVREHIYTEAKPIGNFTADDKNDQSSVLSTLTSILLRAENIGNDERSLNSSFTDGKLASLLQTMTEAKEQQDSNDTKKNGTNFQELQEILDTIVHPVAHVDDCPLSTRSTARHEERDDLNSTVGDGGCCCSKASAPSSCTSSDPIQNFLHQIFVDLAADDKTKQFQCQSNVFKTFRWSLLNNVDAAERAVFRRQHPEYANMLHTLQNVSASLSRRRTNTVGN